MQKGECWTWNQRLWEARVLFPLGVRFCYWKFLFSHSKASDANIGIMGKLECSFHFFLSPSHFLIIAHQRSCEKVMFLQMFVSALEYDATSCLALWSHVISGGMMSLSVWLSVPMFFSRRSVGPALKGVCLTPCWVLTSSGYHECKLYASY